MALHRDSDSETGRAADLAFCAAEARALAMRLTPPGAGLLDRLIDGAQS